MFITKHDSKVSPECQHVVVILVFTVYITFSQLYTMSHQRIKKATLQSNLLYSSLAKVSLYC
jgi:BarA-like signal transduction histidine kinase